MLVHFLDYSRSKAENSPLGRSCTQISQRFLEYYRWCYTHSISHWLHARFRGSSRTNCGTHLLTIVLYLQKLQKIVRHLEPRSDYTAPLLMPDAQLSRQFGINMIMDRINSLLCFWRNIFNTSHKSFYIAILGCFVEPLSRWNAFWCMMICFRFFPENTGETGSDLSRGGSWCPWQVVIFQRWWWDNRLW